MVDIGFGFKMSYYPGIITGQFSVWKWYCNHKFGGNAQVDPIFYNQHKDYIIADFKNKLNIKLNRFDRKAWTSVH